MLNSVLPLSLSCKRLEELFIADVFGFISYFRKMFIPNSVFDKQVPHASQSFWQKKIRLKRRKSRKREKWMKAAGTDTISPSRQIPKYIYPCPDRVLEIMLKRAKKFDAERYGAYLQEETEVARFLRSLIRVEAWEVFEGGDFDREK
jgi:hypothetical protein